MSAPTIAIATNNGDIGGGEVMLLNIAGALRDLGHEVMVIGPASPGELVRLAQKSGFQTTTLRATNRREYIVSLCLWRLRHRRIPLWCNGLVPSFATAGIGPRIVHFHILPVGLNAVAARVGKLAARRVLVPSQFMADRIPGSKVLVNWTEEIPFRPRSISVDQPLRIGFLGRLTRDKGVDVLARAVRSIIRETDRDVQLILAGENRFGSDADDREIVAALAPIADRVIERGWVARDMFFDDIDLAVFPSVWEEPFGLVAAEAMAAGVPFIISDSGALPEVAGSRHPWIAERGDSEDLARVLSAAVDDLSSSEKVVAASRSRWEREFSPRAGKVALVSLLSGMAHETPENRRKGVKSA